MSHKPLTSLAALTLALLSLGSTGCTLWPIDLGPQMGIFGVPIPVSPFYQDQAEDRFWMKERYERVPILGPITSGDTVVALDPPSPDEVMRALPTVEGNVPLLWERQRNNVRMTIEPIGDYVDPPRVYPLIGPAQVHHAHYKCTVYYTEVTHVGWPVPYTTTDEDAAEVVYIDHEHFHQVGNVEDTTSSNY